MKKTHLPIIKTVFVFMILLISCSDSDNSLVSIDLQSTTDDCQTIDEEGRKVVATFTEEEGTILSPGDLACRNSFTIKGGPDVEGRTAELLIPCNLPESARKNGQKVIFSGQLYESFELENVCAQKILLTTLKLKP